ncbi:hypothetical protein ABTM86_19430 [Acinetobacter baumannii]
MSISRAQLKRYREAISMWLNNRYDTMDIATELELPESLVARWVANFRDLACEAV